jgi:hypothetical protein
MNRTENIDSRRSVRNGEVSMAAFTMPPGRMALPTLAVPVPAELRPARAHC